MEDSIVIVKDSVTILVPVVTGYIVLFSGSIGKIWLEHRNDLSKMRQVLLCSGLSIVLGILSISFCLGVMSLLLKASYGDNQNTFWKGILSSQELVGYAHDYLMVGWVFFILSIVLGFLSYFFIVSESLTKPSSRRAKGARS